MFVDLPVSINNYDINLIQQTTQAMQYDFVSTIKKPLAIDYGVSIRNEKTDSLLLINSFDRKEVLTHLYNISKLQDNWDYFGANNISNNCINNAKKIILGLYKTIASPEIYPNPNGTITLDWEVGGQQLSIEIGDTHYSSYWEIGDDTKTDSGFFEEKIPNLLFIALQHMYTNSGFVKEEYALSFC